MRTAIFLLLLLIPNISKSNELFSPIFIKQNCSTAKIIKRLPKEFSEKVKTVNKTVIKISKEFKVNPCLILSMVWTESTFKASQRSFKGARGLMQVMPRTASAMRLKLNYNLNKMISANLYSGIVYQELESLILGTYYYSELLKKFKGNSQKAVIAYNMGPSFVYGNYNLANHNYFKKVNGKFKIIAINN